MNAQELARRFLGNFIHALALNEQVDWLEAQPEIEDALNAFARRETWMTTRFVEALDAVCKKRARRVEEITTPEASANALTIAALLQEATLPQGVDVKILPGNVLRDSQINRAVTLEFVAGAEYLARYTLDPKFGAGKLRANYKRFVREHLAAHWQYRTREAQNLETAAVIKKKTRKKIYWKTKKQS